MPQNQLFKNSIKDLRSFYFLVVSPGIAVLLLGAIYETQHQINKPFPGKWFSFTLLGLILTLSYIMPMWLRLIKIKSSRERKDFGLEAFTRFEKKIIILMGSSIYLAPLAFVYSFPEFPKFAVAFAAIYALYVGFPFERKMKVDKNIFGVDE